MKFYLFCCIFILPAYCFAQITDISNSNNQFTFDFYRTVLSKEKGNSFASPFSISSAFAMVYAGAEGETLAEMSKTLYFSPTEDFHAKQGKMQADLQASLPKGMSLEVANALWIKQGFQFLPTYQNVMQKYYKAKLQEVNFDNPAGACDVINEWTSDKTRQKIKKILAPNHISRLTRLVLTNAIYFKANWAKAFDKKDTQPHDFMVSEDSKIRANFMHTKQHFRYMENEQLQMLEIPYTDNSASMVVLLPQAGKPIEELEKNLAYTTYQTWASQLSTQHEVHTFLPKFKIESDFNLNEPLKEMGIKRAFEEEAEFEKIIKDTPLLISQVLHKSFVEVNEEGTEAAAVTAIIMNAKESAHFETPTHKVFFANRPFIFLIKDHKTGAILFIGKVMSPKG